MISDDEKKYFQDAMYNVKKYVEKESVIEKTIIAHKITSAPAPLKKTPSKHTFSELPLPKKLIPIIKKTTPLATVSGQDVMAYAISGLQTKKQLQLKKDKIKAEATLDLHDHTADEALIATEDFIERSRKKSLRAVCIIHGKGLYSSNNQPVLKNILNHYLREHKAVLAFHSSKNNTGSMIVLLKNKSSAY